MISVRILSWTVYSDRRNWSIWHKGREGELGVATLQLEL